MKKTILLIDGGFLRSQARYAKHVYDPHFIEKYALACQKPDEELLRVLYYDCAPYTGSAVLPISGMQQDFHGSGQWLHDVAALDLFAVRLGTLRFRGYVRKKAHQSGPLTDADFKPEFEQKGVDMRIGLDIASYSAEHLVDRIILITNDTDCVPAMKFARIAGIQTVLIQVPNRNPHPDLIEHADFKRLVPWP